MILTQMIPTPEDEAPEQLELSPAPINKAEKIEKARAELLKAVDSCQLNTLEQRVAWILSRFPKTRDSDIALQLRYWKRFEEDRFDGEGLSVRDYLRLTKLTSIERARRTIQNTLKLFQATAEIAKRRKQLQDEQHSHALQKRPNHHMHAVFIDESGKSQDNLVVGGFWYLNGAETLRIYQLVTKWKKENGFDGELHFQSMTEAKLPKYLQLADLIAEHATIVSFKAISVARRGCANIQDALFHLTHLLLVRGLEHEHQTRRAPLPRGLQVCKDAEEEGQDKLFVARLSEQMKQAAATQFEGKLYVDEFSAQPSKENVHLQIADLFTSSVGRRLNATSDGRQAKDRFADYFLNKIGVSVGKEKSESLGDMTVHMIL